MCVQIAYLRRYSSASVARDVSSIAIGSTRPARTVSACTPRGSHHPPCAATLSDCPSLCAALGDENLQSLWQHFYTQVRVDYVCYVVDSSDEAALKREYTALHTLVRA
jgi:hypothetical protein